MPRWPIALTVATALLLAGPSPAEAAKSRPRACVATAPTAPRCHRSATFERGVRVVLRSSEPGVVWRRLPRGRRLVRVGHTGDDRTWAWTPKRRHVHPAAPYTFVVTRARATTNPVKVWIFPRHG